MVEFRDRRPVETTTAVEVASRIKTAPGDRFAKSLIHDRYLIRTTQTDTGKHFVLHEALPNGSVAEHGEYLTRYAAQQAARDAIPTSTYEL